ncbi:MAG TPA: AsmA family protein [Candidatus Angelobacter sp.]
MASLKRRTKIAIGLAAVLLLGIFLPPNINGTRFRDKLAPALGAALGRTVTIGQVKYRLLPRPGFDLYDFRVADDPAFSAEPLLMCGKVTADLRLTSLWQGRLEIANLKLTDDAAPPSLNLVYLNGHWNLESLMLRAGQVPTAPTAKRRAEQRARFPYIETSGGRINLKVGPEKKPYTLTNTDFAFWLAAEDVWHLRLEGHPVRTDMNLNDTGTVKLEGDVQRSHELASMPVKLNVSWEKTQLGQLSSLLLGQDRGWRGDLQGNAQLEGTPANLHVTAAAELGHFRRYDINRDSMPRLRTRCLGDAVHGMLELKCDTPLETGGLLLTGRWSAATPFDYDLSVVANHVPLSVLATFARHARRTLPDDLTATGDFNGAFGFHSHNGARNWHGAGMTSPFVLESAVADKPFPVSSIKFHAGPVESSPPVAARRSKLPAPSPSPAPQADSLTIDSFSIQLGPSTTLEVQGNLDSVGYRVSARGMVPLEQLLALGKAAGFQAGAANFSASAVVDLNVSGPWANFAPPHVRGTTHLQNLTAWIPGIKDRLLLSQADAQLTDAGLVLAHINGQFEHSPVAFTGSVTSPWSCQTSPVCQLEFDLHSDTLAITDVAGLFAASDKGWSLAFRSDSPASGKLPEFRGKGTWSVDQLTVAQIPLEKFTGHVEVGDQALVISHISAKLGGGSATGDWRTDWTGPQPRHTASGTVSGVALDRLGPSAPYAELLTSWITGKADLKYSLHFEGTTAQEMISTAAGRGDFTVAAGGSRVLLLEASRPLRFQSFQGSMELEKQTLKVLPSKFRVENRIYEVSGTLSLADKQATLKMSNGGARWEITGAMDRPRVAAQPMTAQTTSTHPR